MADTPVTDRFIEFACRGGETALDVDWQVLAGVEITVTRIRDGAEAQLAEGDDYDLRGIGKHRGSTVQLRQPALKGDGYRIVGVAVIPDQVAGITYVVPTLRGTWAAGIPYRLGDAVRFGTSLYICIAAHTSGATSAPETGVDWTARWIFALSGSLQQASVPTFSPAAGSYDDAQTVTIATATAGAALYYTTDGSTPSASSTLYTGPITVSSSQAIKAIAIKAGYVDSTVASAAYTIGSQVAAPTFSPAAGAYGPTQSVAISCATPGALIYYTTNGSTPTSSSSVYSGPVSVASSLTLKAIAVKAGFTDSAVSSAAYTINGQVATPTFSPAAGAYGPSQTVTISCATAGAAIYYTRDGSPPTSSSTPYTGPITVSSTETIKAIATKAAFADSAIATASYTINGTVATPTFSSAAGADTWTKNITISCATAGATIHYTTNGTNPTTGSAIYSAAVALPVDKELRALAVKAGFSDSAIGSFSTPGYDIIPLGGQSNQLGLYGPIDGALDAGDARILQYANSGASAGTIVAGIDPLWHPTQSPNTIGPGMAFARARLPKTAPNRSIVLVPWGVSNTGYQNGAGVTNGWQVGGTQFNGLVAATNAAAALGTGVNKVTDILWVQGEGSAMIGMAGGDHAWYIDAMATYFRSSMNGAAAARFIVVGMNQEYFATGDATFGANAFERIEAALANTPSRLALCAYVACAAGSGADIHVNAAGQRANGAAAAAAVEALIAAANTPAAPSPPTGLTHTAVTASSVSLAWTAPASGAIPTDYQVQYKRTSDSSWSTYSHGRQITTAIDVTGLTSATSYDFRVASVSTSGTGSNSSTYTVSTSALPVLVWDASRSNATVTISNAGKNAAWVSGSPTVRTATAKSAGKWYAEAKLIVRASNDTMWGFSDLTAAGAPSGFMGNFAKSAAVIGDGPTRYSNGFSVNNTSTTSKPTTMALNDTIVWAFDADAGAGWVGIIPAGSSTINWWGGQDPAAGTGHIFTWTPGTLIALGATLWAANTLQLQSSLTAAPPGGFTQLTT